MNLRDLIGQTRRDSGAVRIDAQSEAAITRDVREQPKRRWQRLNRGWAIVVGVSVVVALVAGILDISGHFPFHRQVYAFTDPSPDTTMQESCAFTAIVKGTPPAGQVIVVSNQVQGVGDNIDPFLHFGRATPMPNTDKWYVDMQIGINTTSAGTPYTLTAWLVDANWVERLTQNLPHQQTWWNDKKAPPGAKAIATANVTRKAMRVPNCWK